MGDPNHSGYQFVGKVQRAVDAPVRVVPGHLVAPGGGESCADADGGERVRDAPQER